MENLFLDISGTTGALLWLLSMARQVSWKFESAAVTVLQYGLAVQAFYWFWLGLLAEVTLYG